MTTITLQYFAVLREQARCSEEHLDTAATTLAELYEEMRVKHGFTLPVSMLRVAVNEEFRDWSSSFGPNDRVVFIPPVAGG